MTYEIPIPKKYIVETTQERITLWAHDENDAKRRALIALPYCPPSAIRHVMHADKPVTGHRNPTQSEIRFGHGATHYKDFTLEQWLHNGGGLKKWIKCPFDGLRYYRG